MVGVAMVRFSTIFPQPHKTFGPTPRRGTSANLPAVREAYAEDGEEIT